MLIFNFSLLVSTSFFYSILLSSFSFPFLHRFWLFFIISFLILIIQCLVVLYFKLLVRLILNFNQSLISFQNNNTYNILYY